MNRHQWIVKVSFERSKGASSRARYATFVVPSRSHSEAERVVKEFLLLDCGCTSRTELVARSGEEFHSDWNRFDLGRGISGYFVPEEHAARLIAAASQAGDPSPAVA